jgi:hypothetical protein
MQLELLILSVLDEVSWRRIADRRRARSGEVVGHLPKALALPVTSLQVVPALVISLFALPDELGVRDPPLRREDALPEPWMKVFLDRLADKILDCFLRGLRAEPLAVNMGLQGIVNLGHSLAF